MNAHSARFSARRKGSSEPKPQVFLKVLAQKSSNRRVSSRFLAFVCRRTSEELFAVPDLSVKISSYGDGGILCHGWGGGGSASLWRRFAFGRCASARFVGWSFSCWLGSR